MANIIRIKRRAAAGAAGAPGALSTSELAFNEADNTLYIGFGDNGSGLATSIKSIAGEGSYTTLSTAQTISGVKTFSAAPLMTDTLALSDNSTKLATTAYVKGQNYLTGNQTITVSGDASGSGTTAISLSISDTTVTGKLLTNYTVGANTAIAATDSILTAMQKLQGQVNARLTGNQTITVSGDATGSGTTAITLTLANSGVSAGTYTKVTVNAKGLVTSATTLAASDIPTLTASKISDFDTQVRTSRLDQMAAPTASVSLNSQRITSLAEPVSASDAATKNYVDTAVQGLDVKGSVHAASSSNITLATPGATIGGVTMVTGDRVLLFGQTAGAENGIYVWNGASSAMTRATDADSAAKLTPGSFFFVEEGTFADNGYVLVTDAPITLGTTVLTFTQFSGAGQITAGAGLTKTGNTIDVVGGSGILVNSDNIELTGQALAFHNLATSGMVARTGAGTVAGRTLTGTSNRLTITNGDGVSGNPTFDISSAYVGQNTITTLGTISTGVWQGTLVGLAYGGTGANLSASADGSIFKKSGTAFVVATAGTDYLNDSSTINGGTF